MVSSTAAIGSVLGGLASGMLTDRLARRDLRWQIGIPIAGIACAVPTSVVYFMVPPGQIGAVTVLVAMYAVFLSSWAAPTYAALSFVVAPQRRATANAMLLLASSVIGSGASPIFTGWLSDFLAPVAGANSLRYALVISMGVLLAALAAFVAAWRAYPAAHRMAREAALL
jgi:MFS family permease